MSHFISSVRPSWTTSPLTYVRSRLAAEVPVGDGPGPSGHRVEPADPEHGPGVGVAEVVQAVVVGDGWQRGESTRVGRGRCCARSAMTVATLALAGLSHLQPLWADDVAPWWLLSEEVGLWRYDGGVGQADLELVDAAAVVGWTAITLEGTTGWQVVGLVGLDAAAVTGDEFVRRRPTSTAAPSRRRQLRGTPERARHEPF